MTEYRLVPVEPTFAMLEASRPWPTHWGDRALASNEQKAAYLADHMTVASDHRAMLSAAPPAPTREEVARVIYDELEGPIANQDFGRQMRQWAQCEKIADAILSLLGMPE